MLPMVYVAVFLLSLLSGLTTLIGIALALLFKESVKKVVIGIGFSAGIMLLISFFDLIPESVDAAGIVNSLVFVLLGVLMIGSLNFIIPHTHLAREREATSRELKAVYLIARTVTAHHSVVRPSNSSGSANASAFVCRTTLS